MKMGTARNAELIMNDITGKTLAEVLGANGNHLGGKHDDRIEAPDRYSDSAIEWLYRCQANESPVVNCRCMMVLSGE